MDAADTERLVLAAAVSHPLQGSLLFCLILGRGTELLKRISVHGKGNRGSWDFFQRNIGGISSKESKWWNLGFKNVDKPYHFHITLLNVARCSPSMGALEALSERAK